MTVWYAGCIPDSRPHGVTNTKCRVDTFVSPDDDGFGGLVVSLPASGSRVRGFKPGRSRWIFLYKEKFLSLPSSGGEVK
jgi:hypothetical protein